MAFPLRNWLQAMRLQGTRRKSNKSGPARRRKTFFRPTLDELEPRLAPASAVWIGGQGYSGASPLVLDWDTAANWSAATGPNGLPGPSDDVVIDSTSNISITHASGIDTVKSVTSDLPITLSGGSLTVAGAVQEQNGASFTLSSGTLSGATVTADTTITATNSGGTLDGVTLDGTLDLATNNNAAVNLTDGLTLNGTINIGAADGSTFDTLDVNGTQTVGSAGLGSIVLGGSQFDSLVIPAGTTLTVGAGVTIDGQAGIIGTGTPAESQTTTGGTLINEGTIAADATGAPANSLPGTLTIASAVLTNALVLDVDNGEILNIGRAPPMTATAWTNTGTIVVGDGTLNLNGTGNTSDLGTFNRTGGTVNLAGTLTNNDAPGLVLDDSTGAWTLTGGTIDGGTVTTNGDNDLHAGVPGYFGPATLNAVTLDGVLDLTTTNVAEVIVTDGLILNGSIDIGADDGSIVGTLAFSGTQTLSTATGGNVVFGDSQFNSIVVPTGTTLDVGPGVTIDGQSGVIGTGTPAESQTTLGGTVINDSTIAADAVGAPALNTPPGVITIASAVFTNDKDLEVTSGETLNIGRAPPADVTAWSNTGTITIDDATLNLNGAVHTGDLGTFSRTGGTVNLAGTLTNDSAAGLVLDDSTGPWTLTGGTIVGGTIATNGGNDLRGGVNGYYGPATLDGVTLDGVLDIATTNVAEVIVTNGLTLNGSIDIGSADGSIIGTLAFSGNQTLSTSTGGSIVFGGFVLNSIVVPTGTMLDVGPGVTIDGQSGVIGTGTPAASQTTLGGTVINDGTIAADAGGTLTVLGAANYSAQTSTLTGGTWEAVGASTLRLLGANVVTNAANILLDGAAARFFSDNGGTNALAGLTTNAAGASFTIRDGANVTTGSFDNQGSVTLGADSALTVNGDYTQAGGSIVNFEIAGATPGSGFGLLGVEDNADLDGTANVTLVNGFLPQSGQTFQVMTCNGLKGSFAGINGLAAGSFTANLSDSGLLLTSGPSADPSQSVVTVAPADITAGMTANVVLQARDAAGNDLTTGGLTVTFGLDTGTAGGTFDAVTDNGDGTYSAQFTGTTAGTNTITATIGGSPVTSTEPSVTVTPGAVSLANSTVSLATSLNVGSTTTVTLTAVDAYRNAALGGLTVGFKLGAGKGNGTFSTVSANDGGIYVTTLTATSAGTNTVTATINGQAITSPARTVTVTTPNAKITSAFKALGGISKLGTAVTGDVATPAGSGVEQQFQNATLIYSAATGVHEIDNVIASEYAATASETNPKGQSVAKVLGLPTSSDLGTSLAGVDVVKFQGGRIYASSATGAHVLYGDVATEYAATANEKVAGGGTVQAALGLFTSDEAVLPGLKGATVVKFQNGSIYSSPSTGAHVLLGDIDAEYSAAALEFDATGNSVQKVLGLPTSDASAIIIIGGSPASVARFQGGNIYDSAVTGAHVLYGAINTEYAALATEKDASGQKVQQVVGLPTGEIANVTGASIMSFQGGTIYWSPASGAHAVYGPIAAEYAASANETDAFGHSVQGLLGLPRTEAAKIGNQFVQHFQGGAIYESISAHVTHALYGPLETEYEATAQETDAFGHVVQTLLGPLLGVAGAGTNSTVAAFQGGSIYWSPDSGPHVLYGAIATEYDATAQERDANGHSVQDVIGFPGDDETNVTTMLGVRVVHFQNGAIYWSRATGAHVIYGAIQDEYIATAEESVYGGGSVLSALGPPTSDETPVPGVDGARMNTFQGGVIYWSPDSGASAIYGAIGQEYQSMGGPASSLGLPITDEESIPGGRVSYFQDGKILWYPKTGAHSVQTAPQIDYNPSINFSDGTPVGGSVHLTVRADGSYTLSGQLHDSGFPSYDDTVVVTLISPAGIAFTFPHTGHMAGTAESGSRDDNWAASGQNPNIAADWADLQGATGYVKADVSFDANVLIEDIQHAWNGVIANLAGGAADATLSVLDGTGQFLVAVFSPPSFNFDDPDFRVITSGSYTTFNITANDANSITPGGDLPPGLQFGFEQETGGGGAPASIISVSGITTAVGTYVLDLTGRNFLGRTTDYKLSLIVMPA